MSKHDDFTDAYKYMANPSWLNDSQTANSIRMEQMVKHDQAINKELIERIKASTEVRRVNHLKSLAVDDEDTAIHHFTSKEEYELTKLINGVNDGDYVCIPGREMFMEGETIKFDSIWGTQVSNPPLIMGLMKGV
jgi:hypothetical protein